MQEILLLHGQIHEGQCGGMTSSVGTLVHPYDAAESSEMVERGSDDVRPHVEALQCIGKSTSIKAMSPARSRGEAPGASR